MISIGEIYKMLGEGYAADHLSIDRVLIENNFCPGCKSRFVYRGISNQVRYRAFGVCEKCGQAKEFWMEPAAFSRAKKVIGNS